MKDEIKFLALSIILILLTVFIVIAFGMLGLKFLEMLGRILGL